MAITSSPLDFILPASLIVLELDLLKWELWAFMLYTDIPRSWKRTREALPHLKQLVVRISRYDTEPIIRHLGPGAQDSLTILESIPEISIIPQ